MFKYCVWYIVKKTHPVHKMMSKYSSLFKTPRFPPHITIQSKLNKSEAIATYNRYLSVENPVFTAHGHPKITHERFPGNIDFYAIEQPLNTNGAHVEGIHLSLAYRINKTFTPMELAHTEFVPRIYNTDLSICIMNCESENPEEWERVK
tara:strand:- start:2271 stop:2717 length:447 start_codon:yes stop_codon:yes gene_type:complete